MRTGNITLSPKPNFDDFDEIEGICAGCHEATRLVPVDNSFSDQFGLVTDWSVGSECCGDAVYEGEIFLDVTKTHTAQKDHCKENGRLIVAKGQKYHSRVVKGYYIDDNGEHHGIFMVEKRVAK